MDGMLPPGLAGRQQNLQQWFWHWLANAQTGDRITYYIGFLALGIGQDGQQLPELKRQQFLEVARLAWRAADYGLVHLFQHRLGDCSFEYLAVARPRRPESPPCLRI